MTMGYTRIGRILRAHGTSGEVVIEPDMETDVFTPDQVMYLYDPSSEHYPIRVTAARKVVKGGHTQFFVFFGTITTRNLAEALRGKPVFVPASLVPEPAPDDEDWDLTGYRVIDPLGTHVGDVLDVIENPAHPLLEVKGDTGSFLIPFVDAYIIDIDDENATIKVQDVDHLKDL
jgi:16S rRNA processing protein RimM